MLKLDIRPRPPMQGSATPEFRIPGTDLVVQEKIATTNVSTVYRVRSESIRRQFCAKFINRFDNDERWRREVKALANLSNPHIVKLFRTVEVGDDMILIMDWAAGAPLSAIVAENGPLSTSEAETIARQLSRALLDVHELGLVHRDVRPENAMIDRLPSGEMFARLLDFGLAKPIAPGTTSSSNAVGSPFFAAPEQVHGEVADRRTDIYQLGCLVYFALTGVAPFVGADASAVMNAHLYQPAPRLSDRLPDLAESPLEELLQWAMQKSPDDRPQSCRDVLDAIDGRPSVHEVGRADQTNPLPPSTRATISTVGPDNSVVTATGSHVVVQVEGVSSHFDVRGLVSAIYAAPGAVYYGTDNGEVFRLDVRSAEVDSVVQLPRMRRISDLAMLGQTLIVADVEGAISLVEADGTYDVLRCADGEDCPGILRVAASELSDTFVIVRSDRRLTIFRGAKNPERVGTLELDFDPQEVAVSPDGYVVAVLGEGVTWIVNALDAAVLHRLKVRNTMSGLRFGKGTLVGIERTNSGTHKFFDIC